MKTQPLTEADHAALEDFGLRREEKWKGIYVHCYEPGEVLCREGETLPYLHILRSGRAKVRILSENGRALLLSYYEGAGLIGDVELMTDGPCTTGVSAVTALKTLALPMEFCRGSLMDNPVFLRRVSRQLAEKLYRSSRSGADNLLRPLPNRLADYILMAEGEGFCENLTQLSEVLGVSYRHLERVVGMFAARGMLQKVGRGSYQIKNREELQKLAAGKNIL